MISLKLKEKIVKLPEFSTGVGSKHLYVDIFNGDETFASIFDLYNSSIDLKGEEISKHFWFQTKNLTLRSDYLRPTNRDRNDCGERIEGIPTGSIHKIADRYRKDWSFNNFPIVCSVENEISFLNDFREEYKDTETRLIVYGGRHRVIGAALAEREYILGFLVGQGYPDVFHQKGKDSNGKDRVVDKDDSYFKKPLYSVYELAEKYRYNPFV